MKEEPEGGSVDKGGFVSNSGLIVNPVYRGSGVARAIKDKVFALSREKYPDAAVFSITTGAAERFWDQCRQCVNFGILQGTGRTKCLCTAMLYTAREVKVCL